jgi:dTDP-glucose 4,6-dehydratase
MRLLVTGALGFVGSALLPTLVNSDRFGTVTAVDSWTYAANPAAARSIASAGVEVVTGNVCDERLMRRLVARHDCVLHLAAETSVDRSIRDAVPFVNTNVGGMHTILEAIRRADGVRMLHVSTDEVWGVVEPGGRVDEQSRYAPRNPYAATKAAADLLLGAFAATYGVGYDIVHFSNLYGPWQHPEKLIAGTFARLWLGRPARLHGDGSAVRSWLHVNDAVEGLHRVLTEKPMGERYIIGSPHEHTNLDVTRRILALFERPADSVEYIDDRIGADRRYAVDTTKATRELNWEPKFDLDSGLRQTFDWTANNVGWLTERLPAAGE